MYRSASRTHQRENFFKYSSAATALAVLQKRSLRWSSPQLFNDPFDVPAELAPGIAQAEFIDACAQSLSNLIDNPPNDTSYLAPNVRLLIDLLKENSTPELKKTLVEALKDTSEFHGRTNDGMEAFREHWRSMVPEMRILCMTECPDHASMWCHYADDYKGVVIELRCVDELDSAWLGARPVRYQLEKPEVYTAKGWADILVMDTQQAVERLLHVATHTKSNDWSSEREWRIASYKRPGESGLFSDYGFNPTEIGRVYLGPKIDRAARESLLRAIHAYPNARPVAVPSASHANFYSKKFSGRSSHMT
ncbi:MAG TPA: DUF2971 domain-containing protein [Steroidobacteraceae bacterium]|nr:DUF2971 domain-containing protein [Steroidobacteraceae bacterium]